MSDRAGAQAELFKPQELAAFVSGLCALGSPAPGVLERCGRAIVRKSRSFKAQEVAMVVRAYAQAGVCDREVFEALARQAIHRRQEFDDPAMVSEVLRSYAEAQHPAPVLFDVLGQRVLEHLPFRRSLQLNAVASLLWAHLLSRHRSPHLVEALAEEAARRASELEPWELGMVARASSALHAATKVVLAALEERAIDIAGELSPRDMANIVWAFAYSGPSQHKSPVFEVLSHRIVHGSRAFRPKDTAAVLWAYSQASHPAPQLFEALATQAVAQSHHYSPRALSATMKALARMGYLSPKAFEVLGKRAAAAANEFDAVSVSNSLWALAAVKHRPDEVKFFATKDIAEDRAKGIAPH